MQNITTDEVVTTNEEQNKDLEETKKRLIKYLDECKAANREQATPEQEQEQPPAAEQEQPTPERELFPIRNNNLEPSKPQYNGI